MCVLANIHGVFVYLIIITWLWAVETHLAPLNIGLTSATESRRKGNARRQTNHTMMMMMMLWLRLEFRLML